MEDIRKLLAISIIKFLKTELESQRLGEEGTEALEVAIQCLETAYGAEGITSNDDLVAIYAAATPTSSTNLYPNVSQVNKEMAELKKVEGNNYMRDGKFNEAINSYTDAINMDVNNAIYYSNRAAAYAKLSDNKNSIADCEKALKIDPSYSKAYGRMGLAYFNDENYEKAIEAYERALKLDPANQPYSLQLDSAREKLNIKNSSRPADASRAAPAAAANPLNGMDLSSLLSNPAVMNMAQNFMSNPQVQNMFSNMMGGGGAAAGAPPEAAQQGGGGTAADPMAAGLGGGFGGGFDFNSVSQFAAQMQQENPEVVENLCAQFQQGSSAQNEKKPEPK